MNNPAVFRTDIIQVADIVSREKSIDKEIVFNAMEEAIQKAGRTIYGQDRDIRAKIDRKNGSILLQKWTLVVDVVEDEFTEINFDIAKKSFPECQIGE